MEKIKIDGIIKDFIGKIRLIRDNLYKNGFLPEYSIVETTGYRPNM